MNDGMAINNLHLAGSAEQVTALWDAIGRASVNFKPLPKAAKGQIGKREFDYAPLHAVVKCVRSALAEQGVSIMQPLHTNGDKALSTLIVSGHGAAILSVVEYDMNKDPQEFGKVCTYIRRYQLQAFFCLEGDKDADDPEDVPAEPPKRPVSTSNGNGQSKIHDSKPVQEATKAAADSSQADTAESAPNKGDERSPNQRLTDAMKQLGWKSIEQVDSFCREHSSHFPEFVTSTRLSADKKIELHGLLVKHKGVAPY